MKHLHKISYLTLSLVMAMNLQAAGEAEVAHESPRSAVGAGAPSSVELAAGGAGAPVPVTAGTNLGKELSRAAYNGDAEGVRALLDAGVPVDAKNAWGGTPLLNASGAGQAHIVRVLLAAGANVDLENSSNCPPINAAIASGHKEVVEILLGADAIVDIHTLWSAKHALERIIKVKDDTTKLVGISASSSNKLALISAEIENRKGILKLVCRNVRETCGEEHPWYKKTVAEMAPFLDPEEVLVLN